MPIFAKYACTEQNKKYIPYSKKQPVIRVFAKAFDYGDIFLESKASMDDVNKENFKMVIVKKGLVFARIQYEYAVLKFTYHQCFVSHV